MVEVIPVKKIGEDERGATHYFDTDRTGEFIIAYRKSGSASGRHYHKGTAEKKNPEQVIIMSGTATINWFDVRDESISGTCTAQAPAMVIVQAWAWHEVIADTDIVVFELNALEDGNGDTFRVEGR